MAENVMKYDKNNESLSTHTSHIKEEYEDVDYLDDKLCVLESIFDTKAEDCVKEDNINIIEISIANNIKTEPSSPKMCRSMINDDVKIDVEISSVGDMKVEVNKKPLFCNNCQEYYRDYCTTCGMLVHILNENILGGNADERAQEDIPINTLEIRFLSGQFGIFALKTIPEGVRFGPFTGLNTSEFHRKIKHGRFWIDENESKFLNWMRHINSAGNTSEQNLLVLQSEDNLYYRSIREIIVGEELLVYFGEEYEDGRNRNIVMDFVTHVEDDVKVVFACTFCCLGFSSRKYLTKHKSVCRKETFGKFSIEDLAQCRFCKIFLDEREYLEYHKPYCYKRNVRKCIPLAPNSETVQVRRGKTQTHQTHKCTKCSYKTMYEGNLRSHASQHSEVKTHKCGICDRRFKTKGYLNMHVEIAHGDVDRDETQLYFTKVHNESQDEGKQFECSECAFQTKYKFCMKNHVKTNHLKVFDHKCEICDYKTNKKSCLEYHIKTKHLKEFKYKCEICCYKTNKDSNLQGHLKAKHLKEFSYKCEMCYYETNKDSNLKRHLKTKHLEEFSYKCEMCDYKTIKGSKLRGHLQSKHLKEFSYKCGMCDYKTNKESNLKGHLKAKHLKKFSYKCEMCNYKTNLKMDFKMHIKTIHLKEFDYNCEICDYKTNRKLKFEIHMKTNHLKEFSYECDSCTYKTNRKDCLENHIKRRHIKEFNYQCEMCEFRTNYKSHLGRHTKTQHLKEFDYECALCKFKTNWKAKLEIHVKTKHLKEFSYKCDLCEYKTNQNVCLKRHTITKHLTKLDYNSEICKNKTNNASHLQKNI